MVGLLLLDCEPDCVCECVALALDVEDGLAVRDCVGLKVRETVPVSLGVCDCVIDMEVVGDTVRDADVDCDAVRDTESDCVLESVTR